MRVLLVSHRFPPDAVAGVERATEGLARRLRQLGDDVAVFTRRAGEAPPSPRMVREGLDDGTTLYRVVGGGHVSTERFLQHHRRLDLLFTIALLEMKPDVVHFNHVMDLSPRFIEISRRYGCPVVLSLHDFFFACPLAHLRKFSGVLCSGPQGGHECAHTCFAGEGRSASLRWGLRSAYYRRLLRTATRVICPSEQVASYFEGYGADPARVRVIRNGVADEILFHAAIKRPRPIRRRLTLGFSGAVVPDKGVHVILEALRVARVGDIRLLVLGPLVDRAYARTLRKAAAEIPGLETRFYGEYRPRDVPSLLAGVDCVVVPSLVPETGGVTAQEALACGLPVMCSHLGALPELVDEGENGFTFDPARPGTLASLLHRVATDETLLRRLRAGARSTALSSMAGYGTAVRRIYEEAVADPLGKMRPGDHEETRFLHDALLSVGFGSTS